MNDHDIEKLRTVWRSDPHPYADGGYCPPREDIFEAVSGGLSTRRRRRVVHHLGLCSACGEVWRVADAMRRERPAEARPDRRGWQRLPPVPAMATAAAAALAIAVGVWQLAPRLDLPDSPPGETGSLRGSAEASLELLVADDRALPRDAFWLSWAPIPEAINYRLRVTGQDLDLVYAAATDSANLKVPAEKLEEFRAGDALFWYVVAELEDGRRVRSETRVARIDIP